MKQILFTVRKTTLAGFFLTTSLSAGQYNAPTSADREMSSGYNAPYRIQIDQPRNFFTSASFLFWQPIQENMQLGVVTNNSAALDLVNGYEVPAEANYFPGFKIAAGMNFDYDDWESCLEYTWFHSNEVVRVSLNPNNTNIYLLPAWQIPAFLNPQYVIGKQTWKLTMNLLNWDLARGYYSGSKLTMRPFMGVRAAFIGQDVTVKYINTTSAALSTWPSTTIIQSADSWGVGPRIGTTLNWMIGKGFRLIGDGSWDIIFTQYNLKNSQTSNTTESNVYSVNQNAMNYLRSHANLDLGFGFGSYFSENKYHFDLTADYCFQVFFDQNMFRSTVLEEAMGKSIMPNGNLYIQGLTLSFRFDY